jgi:hypothetical protein
MVNLIIQVPDELVPSLEGIAASRRMSIQQLAVDRLRSLVTGSGETRAGFRTGAPPVNAGATLPHFSRCG